MNHRPSMNILATAEMPVFERVAARSARSLRWRFLFVAGVCATLIRGAVAYAVLDVLKRSMGGDEDARSKMPRRSRSSSSSACLPSGGVRSR
jgi:hypothetical protein